MNRMTPKRNDPLRRLARVLLQRSHGQCENYTRPAGECFKSGRRVMAKFGADQACPACLAQRALTLASSHTSPLSEGTKP